MIKTLQKKFIITAMIAITVLIIFMLGAINIINVVMVSNNIDHQLQMLSDYDGDPNNMPGIPQYKHPEKASIQPKDDRDKMLSSNFFMVRFDENGNVLIADTRHTATVSETDAIELSKKVYIQGNVSGKSGKYRYNISKSRFGNGSTLVFLDTTDEYFSYLRVLLLSLGIGCICWLLMLLLVIMLSKKAIRPIAENIEKQKQFITNAGHEIKTPLAIIQSNADAMELINGENKWSKNIKEQVKRLDGLMKNMLLLAKMDENTTVTNITNFSLNELLANNIEAFNESFKLKNISVFTEIEENININADKEQITQLISILMENALKYTNDDGELAIYLKCMGTKINLQFENTCLELPDDSPDKLFDRFYRADKARTQKSGGYGIGLSVAKSIVESHSGTIKATYEDRNRIRFTILL